MTQCQLISVLHDEGHYSDCINAVTSLLPAAIMPSRQPLADLVGGLRQRHSLFFLMIEAYPLTFTLAAVCGFLFNIPVAGLLFRPAEAVRRNRPKYLIKNLLLRLLRRLPNTKVLSMLPFTLDPRFAEVAAEWLHDPQLWDQPSLYPDAHHAVSPLQEDVRFAAAGRRVIVALGAQERIKGFDYLVDIWLQSPELRQEYLVVVAGKVRRSSAAAAAAFATGGGLLIDRWINNDEMFALYRSADLIWVCYAPDYDQASGFFGRAFQMGVPAVVREGSFSDKISGTFGYQIVSIPYDNAADAAAHLLAARPVVSEQSVIAAQVAAMAARAKQVLETAIGCRPDQAFPRA